MRFLDCVVLAGLVRRAEVSELGAAALERPPDERSCGKTSHVLEPRGYATGQGVAVTLAADGTTIAAVRHTKRQSLGHRYADHRSPQCMPKACDPVDIDAVLPALAAQGLQPGTKVAGIKHWQGGQWVAQPLRAGLEYEVDTANAPRIELEVADRACTWIQNCKCNTDCGDFAFEGHDIKAAFSAHRALDAHPWMKCQGKEDPDAACETGMTYPAEPEDALCAQCTWERGFSCSSGYKKIEHDASLHPANWLKQLCCRTETCARVRVTHEGALDLSGAKAGEHWVDAEREPAIGPDAECVTTAHLTGPGDWRSRLAGEPKLYVTGDRVETTWTGGWHGAGGTDLSQFGAAARAGALRLGLPLQR